MTLTRTDSATGEFAEFYTANFQRIAGQLYAYLGDHAEAQDLTQEAFCRALDRWSKVVAFSDPVAWVRRVAWNLATSRLRHLQVVTRHMSRQRIEHVDGPGPDRVALTRALATLPPNHRLAVVLHHLGHLSVAEIAEQRGVAEGTVRSWLSRGRSQLAEYFVEKQEPEWETSAAQVIRPAGVQAATATVKRRRTARRSMLAAVLVLAIAIPLAILIRLGGSEPPVIGPTAPPVNPSATATASPIPTRRVSLPGVRFDRIPQVTFVDSQNGWLLYDPCEQLSPAPRRQCGHVLASTGDGGRTWRNVVLPGDMAQYEVSMYVYDANEVTLAIREPMSDSWESYIHTYNGGERWVGYLPEDPPVEAELVLHGPSRFKLQCEGAVGLQDAPNVGECPVMELFRVGSGRVLRQPPWRGPTTGLQSGADGRLWLIDRGATTRIAVSTDEAQTWQELPWPEGGWELKLSPDGKQVWVLGAQWAWELVGDRFEPRQAPVSGSEVSPILAGPGLWLVARHDDSAFFQDGVHTPMPGVPPYTHAKVLPDGTLMLTANGGYYLGMGSGPTREWVHLAF